MRQQSDLSNKEIRPISESFRRSERRSLESVRDYEAGESLPLKLRLQP